MRGFAAEILEMNVLFPEFGKPTKAISANSLSSSLSHFSSPSSPCSAKVGALLLLLKKRAFPLPHDRRVPPTNDLHL